MVEKQIKFSSYTKNQKLLNYSGQICYVYHFHLFIIIWELDDMCKSFKI